MAADAVDEVNPKHPKRRGRIAIALIVLGSILLPLAGLSLWARNQLLNTDRYVRTVKPLAADAKVQAAIADRVTQVVVEAADLEHRAKDALPDAAKFLAAPIAAGAQNVVHDLAATFLASDEFQTLWVEVNKIAHAQIVDLLEGKETPGVSREDGKVVVSLGPIAEQVMNRLQAIVPIDLSAIPTERLNVRFVLVDSDDLASVQTAVELFAKGTWILIGLALVALVVGAFVHPDRRRGLQDVGLAVTISMSVTLLLYQLGRDRYIAALPAEVAHPDAATAVFDILTRYVEDGIRILLLIGVILFVAGWLPGPSRSAVWIRDHVRALAGRSGEAGAEPTGAPAWIGGHVAELRAAVVGLAIVALLLLDHPTAKAVLVLAALVALAFGVIQLIGGGPRSSAHPEGVTTPPPSGSTLNP